MPVKKFWCCVSENMQASCVRPDAKQALRKVAGRYHLLRGIGVMWECECSAGYFLGIFSVKSDRHTYFSGIITPKMTIDNVAEKRIGYQVVSFL